MYIYICLYKYMYFTGIVAIIVVITVIIIGIFSVLLYASYY